MNFWGYRRPDGRVGVRNNVLVLPASVCAADTCRIVASQVKGTVTFHNQNGCSQVPCDMQLTMDTIAGFAANPNIYGTIIISLGCENCQMDLVVKASGLASNPLIGQVCDRLVDMGATAVLSETTEFIGAEHILARRGRTPEIRQRIYDIVHRYEDSLKLVGEDPRDGNPSPGNKAGGLTTLEEKSLGCIHKGGHHPVEEVYDYAKQMEYGKGLVIMDTPGNDPSSVAGMAAGGCQLVLFSTGRGTPTGNPIAPVIKLTANPITYGKMKDNIDVDGSILLEHPEKMDEVADALVAEIIDFANGKATKSESLGFYELAIARVCNYV